MWFAQAADFGERCRDALVGEFLDEALEFVALGDHEFRLAGHRSRRCSP